MKIPTFKNFTPTLVLAPAAFLLTYCGEAPEDSTILVTNGLAVNETYQPAVVKLEIRTGFVKEGICTGTFVNDYQVLTAGHCVLELGVQGSQIKIDKPGKSTQQVFAESYVINPDYLQTQNQGVGQHDIALVNFPKGTSQDTVEIALASPEVGEEFEIIGFGVNEYQPSLWGNYQTTGSGEKRTGKNKVALVDDGTIQFIGVPSKGESLPKGEFAASGPGDSGGPLLVDGKIAGITSGGGLQLIQGQVVKYSMYVDVNNSSAQEFLSANIQ